MGKLNSFTWIFQRLAFMCPIQHVSDVFYVLFGVFHHDLHKVHFGEEEKKVDDSEKLTSSVLEFDAFEHISPFIKTNQWATKFTDQQHLPMIFNFPSQQNPQYFQQAK